MQEDVAGRLPGQLVDVQEDVRGIREAVRGIELRVAPGGVGDWECGRAVRLCNLLRFHARVCCCQNRW